MLITWCTRLSIVCHDRYNANVPLTYLPKSPRVTLEKRSICVYIPLLQVCTLHVSLPRRACIHTYIIQVIRKDPQYLHTSPRFYLPPKGGGGGSMCSPFISTHTHTQHHLIIHTDHKQPTNERTNERARNRTCIKTSMETPSSTMYIPTTSHLPIS